MTPGHSWFVLPLLLLLVLASACSPPGGTPVPATGSGARWLGPLQDGDPAEREAAALALGRDPDIAAVPALIRAAQSDHQTRVRIAAVRALAAHQAPDVVPALIGLIGDDHEQVRLAVCQVLGERRAVEARDALAGRLDQDASPSVQLSALAALGRLGEPAADVLVRRYEVSDAQQQFMVLDALARQAQPVHAELFLAALEADLGPTRQSAARALAEIREPRAVPGLVRLIKDPLGAGDLAQFQQRREQKPTSQDLREVEKMITEEVRRRGGSIHPRMHDGLHRSPEAAIPQFRRLLALQQERLAQATREVAATALLKLDFPESMEALVGLLGSEDPALATSARHAFAQLDADQVDRLHGVVRDAGSPASARIRAIDLLVVRNENARTPADAWGQALRAALMQAPVDAEEKASELPPRLRGDLVAVLAGSDLAARLHAAEVLARHGGEEAAPLLLELLNEPDARVRARAVVALGHLRHAPAVPALLGVAEAGEAEVRRRAIQALGEIGAPSAVPRLLALARQPGSIQVETIRTLGQIGDARAGQVLADLLDATGSRTRETQEVRDALFRALGPIGSADAVPALVRVVEEYRHFNEVRDAMTALGQIGDPSAVQPISAALLKRPLRLALGSDQVADAHGIPALVRIGDARAVETLRRMGTRQGPEYSPSTAIVAIRALGAFEDPQAAEALAAFLADERLDVSVKETAVAPALLQTGVRAVAPLHRLLRETPPAEEGARFDPGVHAAEMLAYLGEDGVAALVGGIRPDTPTHVLGRIIEGLGRAGTEQAVAALGVLAGHGESDVRQWAVVALGRIEGPGARDRLHAALASTDPEVQRWAKWGLERGRESKPTGGPDVEDSP